jgi:hypothetical protein
MRYKLQHHPIPHTCNNDLKEGTDLPVIYSNVSHKKPRIPQAATSAGPIKLKDSEKTTTLEEPTSIIISHTVVTHPSFLPGKDCHQLPLAIDQNI